MSRKTISIDEAEGAAWEALKQDGETWTECLERIRKAATEDTSEAQSVPDDVLTEAHIDDLANMISRKTAEEVESAARSGRL